MYRRVVALIVVAACDRGAPPIAHVAYEIAGLGTWRGQIYGGLMCRVELELPAHRVAVTDPDGTTSRPLSIAAERELLDLAAVARAEPVAAASNTCTDGRFTLRVDSHVVTDSCPLAQPGAAKLADKLSAFCTWR